jgi:hypothetical protein
MTKKKVLTVTPLRVPATLVGLVSYKEKGFIIHERLMKNSKLKGVITLKRSIDRFDKKATHFENVHNSLQVNLKTC